VHPLSEFWHGHWVVVSDALFSDLRTVHALPVVAKLRALAMNALFSRSRMVHALPVVAKVRALAMNALFSDLRMVHAPPVVANLRAIATNARLFALLDPAVVVDDPRSVTAAPSRSDPRRLSPHPPPGHNWIMKVRIAH